MTTLIKRSAGLRPITIFLLLMWLLANITVLLVFEYRYKDYCHSFGSSFSTTKDNNNNHDDDPTTALQFSAVVKYNNSENENEHEDEKALLLSDNNNYNTGVANDVILAS
jgi:hypothetical protein